MFGTVIAAGGLGDDLEHPGRRGENDGEFQLTRGENGRRATHGVRVPVDALPAGYVDGTQPVPGGFHGQPDTFV
jgi:hypothetical protein